MTIPFLFLVAFAAAVHAGPSGRCIYAFNDERRNFGFCDILLLNRQEYVTIAYDGPAGVYGDICVPGGGSSEAVKIDNGLVVNGVLRAEPLAKLPNDPNPHLVFDEMMTTADLTQEIAAAENLSRDLARKECDDEISTLTSGNFNADTYPGSEAVICVKEDAEINTDIKLTGSKNIIFNIYGKMEVYSKVEVAGHLKRRNVIWNLLSDDNIVKIDGGELDGTVLAPGLKMSITNGRVNGQIIARGAIDLDGSSVLDCPKPHPTLGPTRNPTRPPSRHPTNPPTPTPSKSPTKAPTPSPTLPPTRSPTIYPSAQPTKRPTMTPSSPPTPVPTMNPTSEPTNRKTDEPTQFPTEGSTPAPTPPPTPHPTNLRTREPTEFPTVAPTIPPSARPTKLTMPPTAAPTHLPTSSPTQDPTETPTSPIATSSAKKTQVLSAAPTPSPTSLYKSAPTDSPSDRPTKTPTAAPTVSPTKMRGVPSTNSPTSAQYDEVICGKCFRNGCFKEVNSANGQKCLKFECATRLSCPSYQSMSDFRNTTPPLRTSTPSVKQTAAPTPAPTPLIRGTGLACRQDEECKSGTCRSGVCMASPDCYPVKHEYGTPFDENKINLVFVGSAFDKTGHDFWKTQVSQTYDYMKGYNMFAEQNEDLNFFRVDPKQLTPSFCASSCAGIERLLCCDEMRAKQLSDKCFPSGANLQTIVLHNSEVYGGADYTLQNLATMSIHPRGAEVAVHELGHSLFELTDEYSYGPGTDLHPNCALTSDCSKWSDLIGRELDGYNKVKCEPGCRNNRFYVGEHSYMSALTNDVGAVNDRYTCCTYLALTKKMPSYCDVFDFEPNYLVNFCEGNDYQKYGSYNEQPKLFISTGKAFKDKSKYLYVSNPLLVEVHLNHKKDRAFVKGMPVPSSPGLYRKEWVIGDFKRLSHATTAGLSSAVLVKVTYGQGSQRFYFSTNTTVEVPSQAFVDVDSNEDRPGERIALSRKAGVVNLVLDTKGRSFKKIQAKFVSA